MRIWFFWTKAFQEPELIYQSAESQGEPGSPALRLERQGGKNLEFDFFLSFFFSLFV